MSPDANLESMVITPIADDVGQARFIDVSFRDAPGFEMRAGGLSGPRATVTAMTRTVTLSDDEFAVLQAIRLVVADSLHPARLVAVALIDRIASAGAEEPRIPEGRRFAAQPLDVTQPDGHRCTAIDWDKRGNPMADVAIDVGEDLHLALMRPNGAVLLRWLLDAGATDHRRALYRLECVVHTRPMG